MVLGGLIGARAQRTRGAAFPARLSGALTPTGQTVVDLKDLDTDPVDMAPMICGKKAKAYVKQRMTDFPYGLKGKPSFLTDKVVGPTYVATELSKQVGDIPLPRPAAGHCSGRARPSN